MALHFRFIPRSAPEPGWSCVRIGETEAHPLCRELLAWHRVAAEHSAIKGVVPKSAIAADRFPPHLLPHLALLEVLEDGGFRYRLFGTARCDVYGADLTGRLLSEVETGEPNDYTHQLFRSIVAGSTPVITRTTWQAGTQVAYDRVIIPLADADGAVGWLLTTVQKLEGPPRRTVLQFGEED